ncbi:unnamed protein product [Clonostachys rhizophaga]|uniref:Uncharacterized protein n=1 Tax=Clonostachys rhizophaga TaxID=160324 RepID=A0A9N9VBT1_9HYPO|nr:unnamed protein product [Clonostachys rhizophaga]
MSTTIPLTHTTPDPTSSTVRSLAGKVAIVSGSSSGIGLAIATELSVRGATVVINYPSPEVFEEASGAVGFIVGPSLLVCADMSSKDGPGILVNATMEKFGRIDIVVNNAALAVNLSLEETTLDHWDSLVNLNARGTFLLTQSALPYLTVGSGRIINICSTSSRGAPPLQTVYAGTKGMVDSFTRCWAKELPPKYGCTVNAVSPGPTKTAGFLSAGEEAMKILQPTIEQTPAGKRMGEPDEIAYAVACLCEEKARWINGAHLFVNGGLHID